MCTEIKVPVPKSFSDSPGRNYQTLGEFCSCITLLQHALDGACKMLIPALSKKHRK